jgi:anti-anti-sigma factor
MPSVDVPSIDVSERKGITVVTLAVRDLVEHTVMGFRPLLLKMLPTQPARWVLNLPQIEFVASAGIGLIVQLAQKLSSTGGRLAICAARPEVIHLFNGAPHFLQAVPVYADLDAAVTDLAPH